MLYLENNLAGNAFSSSQVSILKLLVSEAATSLEHTRLYSDLQEREARIRRLVDSNIIRHPPDDRLVELRLPPWAGIGKPGSSPPRRHRALPCSKVGDADAFRAGDATFVFIETHLSRGFRW